MAVLWTLQDVRAFQHMQETGVLTADERYLFCGDELRFAYDWIARQMREKVGLPPAGISYPVWAWYQISGVRKRCDLRKAGYAPRGTPLVQIEFEADDGSFLLSDFDDWHFVLNNSYIADSEAEYDAFQLYRRPDRQEKIEESWVKVFDLRSSFPEWRTSAERKTIQATLWSVKASQIRKVQFFNAK